MPFAINQTFKIAFAFTQTEFKVAVNGKFLIDYLLIDIDVDEDETIWEILTGFQIKVRDDLDVQVKEVEHLKLIASCNGFEAYSE